MALFLIHLIDKDQMVRDEPGYDGSFYWKTMWI